MKLRFFKNLALVFAGSFVFALCLYACKKNLPNPQLSDNALVESGDADPAVRDFVRRIKHFKTQLARCKTERVDYNMQIDSALWNFEALINASYTFPEKHYKETVKNDLQFTVDVDENGCLAMNDVAILYEEIISSVRDAYANDGIDSDKSLMTVVVSDGEIIDDKVVFGVSVVSGRCSENNGGEIHEWGPFVPGDCWYFGELGGSCDDPSSISDAAEEIEDWINYLYAGTKVPQGNHRYINCNLIEVDLNGDEFLRPDGYSYIYNSTTAPEDLGLYFSYETLNYYFNGEKKVILQLLPELLEEQGCLPDNCAFIQVDIRGTFEDDISFHGNTIIYGSRLLVPVTELDPVTDLLR